MLKDAGCRQVAIGCEGGTDTQLRKIGKDEKCSDIKRTLISLRKAKIETQCYWVIGLPGDNLTAVKKTQAKIMEYLKQDLTTLPHITVLVPYPNTQVNEQPKRFGIDILHHDWDHYWMNCDPFGCDVPAYDTVLRGKTLLHSTDIYDLWLETIEMVADFCENSASNSP